jgi:hypothetical protein
MAIDIRRNYGPKEDGPSKEEQQEKLDKLMQEFLAKGGKIEKVAPGLAHGYGGLDTRPHYTDAEVKEKWYKENGIKQPNKAKKGRKKRKST